MSVEIASLLIEVDATAADKAGAALDKLTAAGGRAESAAQRIKAATDKVTETYSRSVSAYQKAAQGADAYAKAEAGIERTTRASAAASREIRAARALEAAAMREVVAADKAYERSLAQTQRAVASLRASIDPLAAAQDHVNRELAEASRLYKMGAISAAEYQRATGILNARLTGLDGALKSGVGSSKAMTQAGLNLSRQFADIGVTAAMGMSPLMILIQQGPQVADAFSMAKAEGLGFTAVLGGMAKAAAPVLIAMAPLVLVAGAAAAGFGLLNRELSKGYPDDVTDGLGLTAEQLERVESRTVTLGDTFNATLDVMAKYLTSGPIGAALDWLAEKWNATLDFMAKVAFDGTAIIVGGFIGSYRAIIATWRNFPAVFGDIVAVGFNAALPHIQKFVNAAIEGLNSIKAAMGLFNPAMKLLPDIPEADLSRFKMQVSGAAEFTGKAFTASIGGAIEETRAGMRRIGREIGAGALKIAQDRALKEAGDPNKGNLGKTKKEVDEIAEAFKRAKAAAEGFLGGLQKEVAEFGKTAIEIKAMAIEAAAAAAPTKELAAAIREVGGQLIGLMKGQEAIRAVNDNLKTMWDIIGEDPFPQKSPADEFREMADAIDDASYAADYLFNAFKSGNWSSNLGGMVRAVEAIAAAWKRSKTEAVAALAVSAGNAIGGKAGGALSGAGAGFQMGMMTGNPLIAAGAAVVGGIVGWITGGKAKKAAREEEMRRKAEAEAARVLEIANAKRNLELQIMELSGDTAGALAKAREYELAAMDSSLRALAEQVYALQDAKKAAEDRAAIEIRMMEAVGNASGALAARRAAELKSMDAASQALLRQVFAQEDVNTARDAVTEAYERESSALQQTIDKFKAFSDGLKRFRDSLYSGPAAMLSPEDQYLSARSAFDATSALAAGGDEGAIADLESVSQAYLDASKDYYASSKEYFADLERVRGAVTATQGYAAAQVSAAQAQLDMMRAEVEATVGVRDAVLSLRDALAAYQSAIVAQIEAAKVAATPTTPTTPAARQPDWGSYLISNPDVMAEYTRNAGSTKGAAYLAQLGIGSAQAFAEWHYNNYGKTEGRVPFADGGQFTVGGMGGTDSQAFGPIKLTPGEVVNVRRPGDIANDNREVVSELRGLRQEMAQVRKELEADKTQRVALNEAENERNEALLDALGDVKRITREKGAA